MAANHASSAIPFAWTDQALDPYPERSASVAGVRKTHPAQTVDSPPGQLAQPGVAFVVFTAAVEPEPTPTRQRRLPILSIALTAFGQMVLGALIAAGNIDPLFGAVACLMWMTCGLLLIAAQLTAESSESRCSRSRSEDRSGAEARSAGDPVGWACSCAISANTFQTGSGC